MGDVHPKYHFVTLKGEKIKNLVDLYNSVKTMDDITFNHHVNDFKNDFHNWVRDIHQDNELANALLASKNKKEMAEVLQKRVVELGNIKKEVKAIEEANAGKKEKPEAPKVKPKKEKKARAKKEMVKEAEPKKEEIPEITAEPVESAAIAPEPVEEIVHQVENIVSVPNVAESPFLMRLTAGDFALGLLIGALAGIIISHII